MSVKKKNESVTDMQRAKATGIPIIKKMASNTNNDIIIRFPS